MAEKLCFFQNNKDMPCKKCKHCDIENKKCYPKSKDCRKEYDLTDDDINIGVGRCDFFELQPTNDYQQGFIDGVNQMIKELVAERQYCPNSGANMESEENND